MTEPEYRKAVIPDEIDALCEFDRQTFADFPADVFPRADWKKYESYWMIVAGKTVGCLALQLDNPQELWIASVGILPEFRRQKFGAKLTQWAIDFARRKGLSRIALLTRQSNDPSIRLYKKFGFIVRQRAPRAYSNPDEPGIVMELRMN